MFILFLYYVLYMFNLFVFFQADFLLDFFFEKTHIFKFCSSKSINNPIKMYLKIKKTTFWNTDRNSIDTMIILVFKNMRSRKISSKSVIKKHEFLHVEGFSSLLISSDQQMVTPRILRPLPDPGFDKSSISPISYLLLCIIINYYLLLFIIINYLL